MKSSQRTAKKKRSRFPEQTFNLPEDIGPGTYDPTAAKDALGPRSPSPDLKHSKPYPDVVDPGQGPAKYSPNKEFVLVKNPEWTIAQKRSTDGPPEDTGGFEFDGKTPQKPIVHAWNREGLGKTPYSETKDLGPGAYDAEKANSQTKVRSYEAFIGKSHSPDRLNQ